MLAGVEVLLVDLPDAGARYFTYVSTTIEVMKAGRRWPHSGDHPRPARSGGRRGAGQCARQKRTIVRRRVVFECRCDTASRPGSWPSSHGPTAASRRELSVVPVSGWRRAQYSTRRVFRSIRPARTCATSRASSLSGHLPLRGHQPVGRPGSRRPVLPGRVPMARPGGRALGAARPRSPASPSRPPPSLPGSRATGSTPIPCWPGSASRSPIARPTIRPPPPSAF